MKIFGKNFFFIFLLAIVFLLISFIQSYAGNEKWKLTFTSTLKSSPPGNATQYNTAHGSVDLIIDESGNLTGIGKVSLVITVNGPNMSGTSKGTGKVTVKGYRESEHLVFTFAGGTINTTGTLTFAGQAIPFNQTYLASSFAPTETTIERKNGAVSKHKYGTGIIQVETTFTLSGGTNIKKIPPPPAGTFPDKDNIWTMEMDAHWTTYGYSTEMKGTANFPLPVDEGPAKGEGPLSFSAINVFNMTGKLILDGYIKNDTLKFLTKNTLDKGTAKSSGGTINLNYGEGLWAYHYDSVAIPVEDGAEFLKDLTDAASHTTGTLTFRLKGEKIERWRTTISGWETLYFGSLVGGGIRVHRQIAVDFEVTKKKYKSGSGTAKLTKFEEYSFPPELYNCGVSGGMYLDNSGTKHNTPFLNNKSFSVSGKKSGSLAILYLPKELYYSVDYQCKLDEKGAEEAYKKDSNINKNYSSSREWTKNFRKVVNDGGIRDIPSGQISKTVQIQLKDGWTREFGNSLSIDYEKITVNRIK
jgi:hypothetical protein